MNPTILPDKCPLCFGSLIRPKEEHNDDDTHYTLFECHKCAGAILVADEKSRSSLV